MQYVGGKFRQGKDIARVLSGHIDGDTVYVEPFLGGGNSAARVARDCKPGKMILSDVIRPLVLMHQKCYNEGVDWMPLDVDRETYDWYKRHIPQDDPMTAWIGIGYQLVPDWFHSYCPYKCKSNRNGQDRTTKWLRECKDVTFVCESYDSLYIPDGAVVYCDPPYANSESIKYTKGFDCNKFW